MMLKNHDFKIQILLFDSNPMATNLNFMIQSRFDKIFLNLMILKSQCEVNLMEPNHMNMLV